MKVKKISDVRPAPTDEVTLKTAGNVMEIRYARNTDGSPIIKLDKDHGLDTRTGEVIDYQHNQNRAGDMASVAQSLKRLRDLINANLEDPDTALWVTLTYAENMTDTKRLYKDFHAFWKRFLRYLKKEGHPPVEYIAAAEPQGRGAWHLHLLEIFPIKAPFIPNAHMAKLWGHGFTKTKSLKGVDNPGLYLTAYLGDMELTEALSSGIKRGRLVEVEVKGKQKKAIVKGARLKLYPPGFNLYRCSRGVKRPEVCQMTEQEAQAKISGMPLTYEKTISITDEGGTLRNIINYRTYTKPAESDNETPTKTEQGTK
ncbi:hypothetical protein D7V91_14665 [bacterium 1xD42-67]|nr:hypothetical protein D7V91_14665 [bacterium 1xD42-67]